MFETITYLAFLLAELILSFCLGTYWIRKDIKGKGRHIRCFMLVIGILSIWYAIK